VNPVESQMYDLGRQARKAGFAIESCNLSFNDKKRCWWVAGFHDEDMELKAKSQSNEQQA